MALDDQNTLEELRKSLQLFRAELDMANNDTARFAAQSRSSISGVTREATTLSTESKRMGNALSSAFSDVILKGKDVGDVLTDLAMKLADLALDQIFSEGVGSSGLDSLWKNLIPSAKGNAFSNGALQPFANGGVVSSPTLFPLQNGTGLAGEAGAEAILPLARGKDGRLGVRTQGGSAPVTMNITTSNADSFLKAEGQVAAMMARVTARASRNQ